jgi:hypothetical protein
VRQEGIELIAGKTAKFEVFLTEHGNYSKELVNLGIKEYSQAFFKPYRVICHVIDSKVVVYLIADGRRDMQSVLCKYRLQLCKHFWQHTTTG